MFTEWKGITDYGEHYRLFADKPTCTSVNLSVETTDPETGKKFITDDQDRVMQYAYDAMLTMMT